MRVAYTERFRKSYHTAEPAIQRAFDRQLIQLLANLRHPSLHAKKYDEARGIWQARINRACRFYFLVEGDVYVLLDIMSHPK